MPQKQILTQVLAEAGKLYNETVRLSGESGFGADLEVSFAAFAAQMETVLMNLQTGFSSCANELSQLNPETEIRYLHICAPTPQLGNGMEQAAIPSTNAFPAQYIIGKGRIHCLALTGNYVPLSVKLTLRQYDENLVEKRVQDLYSVPICNANSYPVSTMKTWPRAFWDVFYWIEPFPSGYFYMPAGVSGIFPYFEFFGYNEDTVFTRLFVTSIPSGSYWCAGIVWESEHSPPECIGSQI